MVEVTLEPYSIVLKLRGFVGSLQFGCGESPNLVCKGPVAASKGTNSGIMASRVVWGREENTVALVASWGALCLHTAPTKTYFLSKGRNFGNTSSSPPAPLFVISYLYLRKLILCCISCLLVCLLLLHHIGCSPSCISRQPTLMQSLNWQRKAKIVSCLFTPPLVNLSILSLRLKLLKSWL